MSAGSPPDPALFVDVWPEVGQFKVDPATPDPLLVSYQYGFPAAIGAGPYDRTLLGDPPVAGGVERLVSDGGGLDTALGASNGTGTVTIQDSQTYETIADVGSTAVPIGSLLVRAGADVRPVVRMPAPATAGDPPVAWVFTGGNANSALTLDGLHVSGGDIVLRGAFASVRLTGCTTDPGTLNGAGDALATSVDARPLAPVRIWIEADPDAAAGAPGAIAELNVDHCVLGPIRTRNGGAVEQITITDSIVQGIAPATTTALSRSDVYDPELLTKALGSDDPLSKLILAALPSAARNAVNAYTGGPLSAAALTKSSPASTP